MTKIAALVLTYNEERRIADTIKALKEFDEIVIYDKSSKDRTREIAEELGAKILQIEYSDVRISDDTRKIIKNYLDTYVESEWLFLFSASDIVHYNLYREIKILIESKKDKIEAVDIPIYKFSMGYQGKHTFLGDLRYERNVIKKSCYPTEWKSMIHENGYNSLNGEKLQPTDINIAVYHLTHPNLQIVMDRHWRYAVQYVKDSAKHGRGRERVMRYSINECIRLVYRYFRRGVYKTKDVGKAQLMMLIMYNCMIYLNAYFNKETEEKIAVEYQRIKDMCMKRIED